MKQVGEFVGQIVVIFAVLLLARATVFPRTFADEEVLIGRGEARFNCFVFDVTNRKMVVELHSTNGVPVTAAVIRGTSMERVQAGSMDVAQALLEPGAVSPSLIGGSLSAYVKADQKACLVISTAGEPARVRYAVKTYVRL